MKNCTDCKYAKWERTKSGALHPNGEGRCTFEYSVPILPAAFYWQWPHYARPMGGQINRRSELKDHCAYYAREP